MAVVTFAGLCEMAEARGWAVALASTHEGPDMQAGAPAAQLRAVAVYEKRKDIPTEVPIVAVRLDTPARTLDQAATLIGKALQVA